MNWLHKVTGWIRAAAGMSTSTSSNTGYVDDYHRMSEPTKRMLLEQYKQTVYTCALLNAVAVASQTLRLYVTTGSGQPYVKRWQTRKLRDTERKDLLSRAHLRSMPHVRKAVEIEEIVEHPALDLLNSPNEYFDGFTLMEMTQLLGEITGVGYWRLIKGSFQEPTQIYLMPTQLVTPMKLVNGFVSYYTLSGSGGSSQVPLNEMIPFSFPNLVDPYSPEGVSPLRAYYETSKLSSKLMAYNHSLMDNRARPEVLLMPKEQLGEAEADRLERRFMRKFRRGGAGGVMVVDAAMKSEMLQFSNRDLEMLALQGATKEDIGNAFDVPVSMLNISNSNRATADAGHYQHARNAVWPRCRRNESKLNKHFAPLYDERLFFAYDNPVPSDLETKMKVREKNLMLGVTTINEERAEDGLTRTDWGDRPLVPVNIAPLTKQEVEADGVRGGLGGNANDSSNAGNQQLSGGSGGEGDGDGKGDKESDLDEDEKMMIVKLIAQRRRLKQK